MKFTNLNISRLFGYSQTGGDCNQSGAANALIFIFSILLLIGLTCLVFFGISKLF